MCPEYRGGSSVTAESSDESSQSEEFSSQTEKSFKENGGSNGDLETNGVDRFERKLNLIESSTDTLVPETDAAVDKSRNGVEVTITLGEVTISISLLCYLQVHHRTKKSASASAPVPISKCFFFDAPAPGQSPGADCDPLDSDGLVSHHDQRQRRLVQIHSCHLAEVNSLRRDLQAARLALTQAGIKPETVLSSEEIPDPFDPIASSGVESTASEVSWEAVEDGDTDTPRPTLWIPDHAASSCMGCSTQFWFGRRKHHCRSCGRLFCSECSDNTVPLPAEQLYTPVRVCDGCYKIMSGELLEPWSWPSHAALVKLSIFRRRD